MNHYKNYTLKTKKHATLSIDMLATKHFLMVEMVKTEQN